MKQLSLSLYRLLLIVWSGGKLFSFRTGFSKKAITVMEDSFSKIYQIYSLPFPMSLMYRKDKISLWTFALQHKDVSVLKTLSFATVGKSNPTSLLNHGSLLTQQTNFFNATHPLIPTLTVIFRCVGKWYPERKKTQFNYILGYILGIWCYTKHSSR